MSGLWILSPRLNIKKNQKRVSITGQGTEILISSIVCNRGNDKVLSTPSNKSIKFLETPHHNKKGVGLVFFYFFIFLFFFEILKTNKSYITVIF